MGPSLVDAAGSEAKAREENRARHRPKAALKRRHKEAEGMGSDCAIAPAGSGVGGERLAHLFHGRHLDLANALGAHAVLGGQFVQRHAARTVVVHLQPTLAHDAARTLVELAQGACHALGGELVALRGLDHGGGLVRAVGQVGNGTEGVVAVVTGRGVEHHVAARQARFHLAHLFGLDVQFARHQTDLGVAQHLAVCVAVGGFGAQALLA